MPIRNAVVPVAGWGTRLLPLSKSVPKELLPVGRKPVVQHVVDELESAGIERILLVNSAGKNAIEDHFDRDAALESALQNSGKSAFLEALPHCTARIFSTRQREQRGLGDAILQATDWTPDEPFAVALGDAIISEDSHQSTLMQQMATLFEQEEATAVIAFHVVPPETVSRYGIAAPIQDADSIAPGASFILRDLIEKPSRASAPSCLAIAARYVFAPSIFEALRQIQPGVGGEIQLTDAVRLLLQNGKKIIGLRLPDGARRYDIGNFEEYFSTFLDFALLDAEFGTALRQRAQTLLDTFEPQRL